MVKEIGNWVGPQFMSYGLGGRQEHRGLLDEMAKSNDGFEEDMYNQGSEDPASERDLHASSGVLESVKTFSFRKA